MGYGLKGESGERFPKGAKSSDRTGEKMGSEKGPNSTKGTKGATGEKMPKGASSSDSTGERHGKLVGGISMGLEDGMGVRPSAHMGKHDGRLGEFNSGNMGESICYDHKRVGHDQDDM
jgi:hypothetical protein